MARQLYDKKGIARSLRHVIEAFEFRKFHKGSLSADDYALQNPKIPSILSESIVAFLISEGVLLKEYKAVVCRKGGKEEADLMMSCKGHADPVRVEVKGSGSRGFQLIGENDLKADRLVWVHFETFFETYDHRVKFQVKVRVLKKGEGLTNLRTKLGAKGARINWKKLAAYTDSEHTFCISDHFKIDNRALSSFKERFTATV